MNIENLNSILIELKSNVISFGVSLQCSTICKPRKTEVSLKN